MRKRGKARLSSETIRATRIKNKYTVNEVTKRYKKLVPTMAPQMRTQLINWDFLEQLLFAAYDELGIPSADQPNYTAWAKRKAEMGVHLTRKTFEAEAALLRQEFITRGLNADWLDALEVIVDLWIMLMGLEIKIYEWWSYALPPTFSSLFSDKWSYEEPPGFSVLFSESWSS